MGKDAKWRMLWVQRIWGGTSADSVQALLVMVEVWR